MASQWLEGTIRHRRKIPVLHEFKYKIGMLALDLDDWETITSSSPFFSLERFNWMSLYRRDYLNPEVPSLRQAVLNQVKSATGWAPDGPIELITHPRYLGYVFNPVSFYLCYNHGESPRNGDVPRVILAQITNTPGSSVMFTALSAISPELPWPARGIPNALPSASAFTCPRLTAWISSTNGCSVSKTPSYVFT